MDKQIQVQTSYGYVGCCTFKRTLNYIFYQVEDLIQGDLGYLVQGIGSFPTQISKFLGVGDTYGPTVPGTCQLCTRELGHIQEDIKLYILLGAWLCSMTSDQVGTGLC